MAHGQKSDEKIVYVGDSRVRQKSERMQPSDFSAYPGKSEVFIPNFLLKEWMVAAVCMVGMLALTMSEAPPLGYPADPTNTSFIPMPDWYFLFMYQLLKYPYTSGPYVVVGTLILPGLLFGGLMLAPFLDRGKERRFYRRPIASALMFFTLISIVYLTVYSWGVYKKELDTLGMIPEHIKREEELNAAKKSGAPAPGTETKKPAAAAIVEPNDPAAAIYQKSSCVACHAADMKGMKSAGILPLVGVGDKYNKEQIVGIMKNGIRTMVAGQWDANKKSGLTDDQLDKLAEWLSKQKAAK